MPAESLTPFIPESGPALGQLGWFALLLIIAVALGEFVHLLRFPRLIGYVVAGMILGPHGSGLMHFSTVADLRIMIDVALGLMLFELGHWLDLSWLKRNPWLIATSLLEAALTFFAVYGALRLAGVANIYATGAAAIGMSTSPAVIVQITRELRSQGQVTERLRMLTALNSAYAVIAITVWLSWLHMEYRGSPSTAVLHPLYLIAGSITMGLVVAVFAGVIPRWLRGHPNTALLLLLGLILLLIAAARAVGLSPLLTLLSFGTVARHWVGWLRVLPGHFATISSITAVVLFALIGASLDFGLLRGAAAAAVAFVFARIAAKWAACFVTAVPSGIRRGKGSLLGLGLAPMSGLAVVLVQDVSGFYPAFPGTLMITVMATVSLLELIGPVLTKVALWRAKETRPD
ncbi:MAG: cation:proton antiporter [Thermoleophilia bacterium]|nr:cation:proton antiporter [Thermoleophilia bacterium]